MSYPHLTPRYVIAPMRIEGFGLRAIRQRIGRHHTTVGRRAFIAPQRLFPVP